MATVLCPCVVVAVPVATMMNSGSMPRLEPNPALSRIRDRPPTRSFLCSPETRVIPPFGAHQVAPAKTAVIPVLESFQRTDCRQI